MIIIDSLIYLIWNFRFEVLRFSLFFNWNAVLVDNVCVFLMVFENVFTAGKIRKRIFQKFKQNFFISNYYWLYIIHL